MRYMTMIKVVEGKYGPPPPALMQAMGKLQEDATKAGVLVEVGGLKNSATGALLRLGNGKITVMDGPFTEARSSSAAMRSMTPRPRKNASNGPGASSRSTRSTGPGSRVKSNSAR
jgi:hypothetical protein